MEFSNVKLLNQDDLLKSIKNEDVKNYLQQEIGFWSENDVSEVSKSWLNFCNGCKNTVKVQEYDIPDMVCPKNMKMALTDIKVCNLITDPWCFKH